VVAKINIVGLYEPQDIADKLTSGFSSDSLKIRAIYYWITQKIGYDCQAYKKGNPIPYNKDDGDYYYKRVRRTLSYKKGVCEDYALTFKMFCDALKIPAEVIDGYGLVVKPYKILSILGIGESNHAWNAVKINNKWYLLDLTWASGYVNGTVTKFTRKRNDYYYLTTPEKFILDHHPDEDR
jgi:transglutaminase/protease-like cytokinesis protein 3